jgi:hypothetical protein
MKRVHRFAHLVFGLIVCASSALCQTDPNGDAQRRQMARRAYDEATTMLLRGQLVAASVDCQAALDQYAQLDGVNLHPVRVLMGEILIEQGLFEKASDMLMDAGWKVGKELKQDILVALVNERLHKTPGNDFVVERAVRHQGNPIEAELGSLDNLPAKPFTEGALATCLILYARIPGRCPVSAEAGLREALRLAPGNPAATFFLGQLLLEEGKEEEGRSLLEDAARTGRGTMPAKARSLLQRGLDAL